MMPARRAVCSGSPLAISPRRINFSAVGLIVMSPRARASRLVTGLSPRSTIFTRPRRSTCDRLGAPDSGLAVRLLATALTLCEIERQALERNGQIHALEFHFGRNLQRAGREIQDCLDPGRHDLIDHWLRVRSRHGDHGDVEPIALGHALQFLDVVDGHPAARFVTDLFVRRVEERGDLEAFLAKPGIVRERESEIARAHDGHTKTSIQAEDLTQMSPQLLDVIADAANAELAEVREVLSDLRGVEMKL